MIRMLFGYEPQVDYYMLTVERNGKARRWSAVCWDDAHAIEVLGSLAAKKAGAKRIDFVDRYTGHVRLVCDFEQQ